jgi:DNA-binding transcriptional LysR family regulator
MLNLNNAFLFVKVIEHAGFSAAARILGQPKSTVSKRVAALEQQLGVRLLQRNSRNLFITEAGRAFYRHAVAMTIQAQEAEASVKGQLSEPIGALRLSASVVTSQYYLAELLPILSQRYPKIQFMLHASDRRVDLLAEGFDIAIRDHTERLQDSALMRRSVGSEPSYLLAAPPYLARLGVPTDPSALSVHDGLLAGQIYHPRSWRLRNAMGQTQEVSAKLRFFSDDARTLTQMAIAGMGIACLPRCVATPHIACGALKRVLPDWTAGETMTTLLYPHRRGQLPALRCTLDFLVDQLGARLDPLP